ncbi:flagellar hook-basal body complex protein FliE [Marivivens sp. LCG002]|uniref:flagellar hook-basal body complex protein FliE n=1 Tax=Marivivens sp. LCG002 TaxID=3051171 RepID=UPI00255798A0|nr:flagellar hook-basal body complex protein FliE [Marivivens sp. LCG002]WIV51293.1 flagellar hook-basal body complex protein FliE [Marivivens sp. LCG002]
MSITSVGNIGASYQVLSTHQKEAPKPELKPEGPSFGDRMTDAVQDLNASQAKARESAFAYEVGAETDLAAVMVNQQVASLSMQLALNVRNKALGAYRDIMNMPV